MCAERRGGELEVVGCRLIVQRVYVGRQADPMDPQKSQTSLHVNEDAGVVSAELTQRTGTTASICRAPSLQPRPSAHRRGRPPPPRFPPRLPGRGRAGPARRRPRNGLRDDQQASDTSRKWQLSTCRRLRDERVAAARHVCVESRGGRGYHCGQGRGVARQTSMDAVGERLGAFMQGCGRANGQDRCTEMGRITSYQIKVTEA